MHSFRISVCFFRLDLVSNRAENSHLCFTHCVLKMTPGIKAVQTAGIQYRVHEYDHDEDSQSYGIEAANKLGVIAHRVFKTLVVEFDSHTLAVAIIPVSSMLAMKQMARATGAKKVVMAERMDVERSTGYKLGGVSPVGQKKCLKTVIDISVEEHTTVYVSAGRRGLEVELRPADLVTLTNATLAGICQ